MSRRGEVTLRHLLSPIDDLLEDPNMVEIVIQKEREVGFERGGKWEWRVVEEFDYRRLDAIGLLSGGLMSKNFDPAHPICTTFLPNGERFTICRSPATDPHVISASIRCSTRSRSRTADDDQTRFDDLLQEAENRLDRGPSEIDHELLALHKAKAWREFFRLAIKARKTIGATGRNRSGKTTFLRERLMSLIDPDDRLITIEDTPEFGQFPQIRNRVSLYFGSANITAEHCFEATLRMRPDRVALQELRGAEVMAFMRLQASGHSGSLTTWHADENDPFTPLVLMAKTSSAGQNVPDDKLEQILKGFIDIIVFCYYDPRAQRFTIPSVYFRGAQ